MGDLMPRRLSILAAPLAFALALTATTDRSHANEFVTAEGDAKPFVYRYHPVNPVDPFDTEAVEIDIVELAGAIGSNAVAASGSASVIHHVAINNATAPARWPSGVMPSGVGNASATTNTTGPANKPAF